MSYKKLAALGIILVLVYILVIRRKPDDQTQYFNIDDIKSRGNPPPPELMANAQELVKNINIIQREMYKENPAYSVVLHSTYRNPQHNADVGGVSNSYHLQARAVDFSVPAAPSAQWVHNKIMALIDAGILPPGGVGQGSDFTHYDNKGTKSTWAYTHGSGAGSYGVQWGPRMARMAQAQRPNLVPVFTWGDGSTADMDL